MYQEGQNWDSTTVQLELDGDFEQPEPWALDDFADIVPVAAN